MRAGVGFSRRDEISPMRKCSKTVAAAFLGSLLAFAPPAKAHDWQPGNPIIVNFACYNGEILLELLGYAGMVQEVSSVHKRVMPDIAKNCFQTFRPTEMRVVGVYSVASGPNGRQVEVYEVDYRNAWRFFVLDIGLQASR
jgi:hypothetical protein